mgnify:CR=1 FL=1
MNKTVEDVCAKMGEDRRSFELTWDYAAHLSGRPGENEQQVRRVGHGIVGMFMTEDKGGKRDGG